MHASFIVRSIDIGYWNLKFTVDEAATCRLFPSIAPRVQVVQDTHGILPDRHTSVVWVDGTAFEVGPDSVLFSEVPHLGDDYTETAEYRALLYGALDDMQVSRIDLLVTGLPVHLHASRGVQLKEMLIAHHTIRPGKSVEILDAAVVAQPLGGFVAHTDERAGWSTANQRTTLLADPGSYTFNWMLTRGLNEIPGSSGGVPWGVTEVLKGIQRELARELGETCANLRRLEEGIRTGRFRLRGRPIDLAPYRARTEPIAARAVQHMRNQIGSEHEIDEIVVVGGGAPYFIASIRNLFPHRPVHIVSDAVFANVRGYQSIGNHLKKRRAA
jgi:plasmid segregation protein ParM